MSVAASAPGSAPNRAAALYGVAVVLGVLLVVWAALPTSPWVRTSATSLFSVGADKPGHNVPSSPIGTTPAQAEEIDGNYAGIAGVSFAFGTGGAVRTGTLLVSISTTVGGAPVRTAAINASALTNGDSYPVYFSPLPASPTRQYVFSVSDPSGSTHGSISLVGTTVDGLPLSRYLGPDHAIGDLEMTLYEHRGTSIGRLSTAVGRTSFLKPAPIGSVALVISGIAALLLFAVMASRLLAGTAAFIGGRRGHAASIAVLLIGLGIPVVLLLLYRIGPGVVF